MSEYSLWMLFSNSATEGLRRTPRGFVAIGIFLLFGALMAGLAAVTLSFRGTSLDRIWTLNPTAYARLAPRGPVVGPLFFLLSAALACATVGWFRRRAWGWWLAVAILATQVLGDVINCIRGDFLRGATGLVLGGALLLYLLSFNVRTAFAGTAS
jgi:hypothetical protein